jgi:hypothetical protein
MAIFNQWAAAIATTIKASADVVASVTGHSELLGDAREVLVRDVFSRFLPTNAIVGTGQIIDAYGGRSQQIDAIIYRSDFPVFRTLGLSDVYLLEGVIAACEVKSTLNKNALHKALENVASVKALKPCVDRNALNSICERVTGMQYDQLNLPGRNSLAAELLPACYVFGFKGYSDRVESFSSALMEWIHPGHPGLVSLPDVICAESIVTVANNRDPFHFTVSDGKPWGYVGRRAQIPLHFLLYHLMYKVIQTSGPLRHEGTGVDYRLEQYFGLDHASDQGWTGLYGEALPPSMK